MAKRIAAETTYQIEAYGNKGFKNTPWRKTFKTTEALLAWAEKNDADITATRDVEVAR